MTSSPPDNARELGWSGPPRTGAEAVLLPSPGRPTITTTRYLIILTAAALPVGILSYILWIAGATPISLMLAAVFLIGVVLYRVELGLFIMAVLIPWEVITRFTEEFTIVKALGMVVAPLGVALSFTSRGPRWPTLTKFAVVLAAWAVVATIPNIVSFELTLGLLALLSNILLMFLFMRFCSTPEALRTLILLVSASSIALALTSLTAQGGIGVEAIGRLVQGRLTVGEFNVNTFVRLLFPGIFLPPLLMAYTRKRIFQVLLLVGVVLCLATLGLTASRGATLGVALGLLVLVATMTRIPLRTRLLVVALGGIVAAVALYASILMGAEELWTERLGGRPMTTAAGSRLLLWHTGLEIIAENPLIGVGVGPEELAWFRKGWDMDSAHNDFIDITIKTGVPGLLLFLGVVFGWVRGLWRLPRGMMRSALLGYFTATLVTAQFNPSLTFKAFWLAAGICAAAIACYGPGGRSAAPAPGGQPGADLQAACP